MTASRAARSVLPPDWWMAKYRAMRAAQRDDARVAWRPTWDDHARAFDAGQLSAEREA